MFCWRLEVAPLSRVARLLLKSHQAWCYLQELARKRSPLTGSPTPASSLLTAKDSLSMLNMRVTKSKILQPVSADLADSFLTVTVHGQPECKKIEGERGCLENRHGLSYGR